MASYAVRKIPLDVAFTKLEIVAPGTAVPDIGVQFLPQTATGNVDLHIGEGGDGIPLYLMGQALHSVPAENDGIYLTNRLAQAGAVLVLIIGFQVRLATPRGS